MKIRRYMYLMLVLDLLLVGILFLYKKEPFLQTMAEETVKKKIALTFDDGPDKYHTVKLLEGLQERDVVVTFFMTGKSAEKYPEIVKQAYDAGHLIGNHTYSHMQLTKKNRKIFKKELIQTNEILTKITGEEIMFVRPPYGSWDKSFEKELNMIPVLWNVDPKDWCSNCTDDVVKRVVSKAKENDIILMHDQYDSSVEAALKIIDILQKQGYEFVTVEDILLE